MKITFKTKIIYVMHVPEKLAKEFLSIIDKKKVVDIEDILWLRDIQLDKENKSRKKIEDGCSIMENEYRSRVDIFDEQGKCIKKGRMHK